jgi:hypothetical protein
VPTLQIARIAGVAVNIEILSIDGSASILELYSCHGEILIGGRLGVRGLGDVAHEQSEAPPYVDIQSACAARVQ